MLKDIKSKFRKSNPSLKSTKSEDSCVQSVASQNNNNNNSLAPALNIVTSQPPPPPVHVHHPLSSRQLEKLPANIKRTSSSSIQSASTSSTSSNYNNSSKPPSRKSSQSIIDDQQPSSATSSSTSISIPNTPPSAVYKHSRYPSNVSLPSLNSEYFLNHDHLKPGNNAELLSYDKTIIMYRENAKRTNDPAIQCDLAIYLYESSKNSNRKPEERHAYMAEAVKILRATSSRGHAESQYYLANIYASGATHKAGKPDFGNAFPLFTQAAKHQHADAAYRAAKCFEDGLGCLKNKSKAVQYYRLAATLNHPGAMYRLGLADINGDLGLSHNVRDGNKWLKRSAEAATPEYPHALHELGLLHEKGLDGIIFKDVQYSVQLYTRAAELGYVPSAYRLGQCYEYGYLGCEKNASSSIYYYTIAAQQGNPDACFALSAWYLSGDPPRIESSGEKALYWAQLAAQAGLPKAEFALGYFAEAGIGRRKDKDEAVRWYKKAATQGEEQARKRLAALSSSLPSVSNSTTNSNTNNNNMSIPSNLVAGEAR
ncbi:MAG: hypothetical protein EXX96DRAFT_553985 [Benjaminiella poitrasii]|nr:MAG: hypothetical protein EXX96DRAFT_553985 [Benjaminiella poitrasii]